jgi:hypothetical protein
MKLGVAKGLLVGVVLTVLAVSVASRASATQTE